VVPSVLVAVGYGTSFYFLSLCLKNMSIGIIYSVWSGLGIVLISVVGWAAFKQRLDWPALMGMGLIISGVMVIHLFSKTTFQH